MILSKTQFFRYILALFLLFECPYYSMHHQEPQVGSHIQLKVDWPFTEWHYYSFLKSELETEGRNDPPFYKLVTKEGRIIYY